MHQDVVFDGWSRRWIPEKTMLCPSTLQRRIAWCVAARILTYLLQRPHTSASAHLETWTEAKEAYCTLLRMGARARACAPSGTKASRRQAPIVNLLLQQPMLLDTGGAEERLHSQAGHVQLWPTPRSCICYWDGIYMDIPIYPEIYTYIPKVYTTINSTPSAQIGRSPFNLRHLSRTVAPFIPSLVSTT